MNATDIREVMAIVAEERRLADVRWTAGLDALAESWARRISDWERRSKEGERHLLSHAATVHDCIQELRAQIESASNGGK